MCYVDWKLWTIVTSVFITIPLFFIFINVNGIRKSDSWSVFKKSENPRIIGYALLSFAVIWLFDSFDQHFKIEYSSCIVFQWLFPAVEWYYFLKLLKKVVLRFFFSFSSITSASNSISALTKSQKCDKINL